MTGWDNTEYRSYEFIDPSGLDPEARVWETKTSWKERRGSIKALTEAEQRELGTVVQERIRREMEAWEREQANQG